MNDLIIIILIFLAIFFFLIIAASKNKRKYKYPPKIKQPSHHNLPVQPESKEERLKKLLAINQVTSKQAINNTERVIYILLQEIFGSYNVFISSQVSLSSFILSEKNKIDNNILWYEYKDLYSDFVLLSKETGKPLYVIEYHGSGHNPSNSEYVLYNDNLKKTLFSLAKIPFKVVKYKQYKKGDAQYQDDLDFTLLKGDFEAIAQELLNSRFIEKE